jgi:hypothetical protein
MAPKVDPAILKALSLDAATTTTVSHGGSSFASTFKITCKAGDGGEKSFFVKQGKGKESEIMFAGNSLFYLISTLALSSKLRQPFRPNIRGICIHTTNNQGSIHHLTPSTP